jgi:hypothetical protein
MPWVFYYQKVKWEEFDESANDLINEALSQDHPPKEVSFVHWWGAGKKRKTEYTVNLETLRQKQDNGTTRAVMGLWDRDKRQVFDWGTFIQEKFTKEREPPAIDAPAPADVPAAFGSQPSSTSFQSPPPQDGASAMWWLTPTLDTGSQPSNIPAPGVPPPPPSQAPPDARPPSNAPGSSRPRGQDGWNKQSWSWQSYPQNDSKSTQADSKWTQSE